MTKLSVFVQNRRMSIVEGRLRILKSKAIWFGHTELSVISHVHVSVVRGVL
jgi:hypothetical protein